MAARHTYRLDLAYDGSDFAGFRRQTARRTVEGELVRALTTFVPELSQVACGGRTDRGVHALGQVVSFWSRAPLCTEEVAAAIEAVAPTELAVLAIREVPRSFHASFSATGRRYLYRRRDEGRLDAALLDAMFCALIGRRSFAAFSRRTPKGQSSVRHLREARVRRDGPGWLRFELAADAFLRRQVRVMVATALREASRGSGVGALLRLCETGDRRVTAPPADPGGLYLMAIDYA